MNLLTNRSFRQIRLALAIGGFLGIVFGLSLFFPTLLFDLSSPYAWAVITFMIAVWLFKWE